MFAARSRGERHRGPCHWLRRFRRRHRTLRPGRHLYRSVRRWSCVRGSRLASGCADDRGQTTVGDVGQGMAKPVQSAMHCRCGREKILANGLCASCYNLKRQDTEYFGGLREAVLERDGNRCRVCDAPGGRKREMIVHHRVPGKSVLALMISLCPGCHAKVHRTRRSSLRGRRSCWCCGVSNTRPGMSKRCSLLRRRRRPESQPTCL